MYMKLTFVYFFVLIAHSIANNEPRSKVMDGENFSRISVQTKSGNYSRRVESPRTLPIPITDAIYESELVKDTGVRGFEARVDRSLKVSKDDSVPVNTNNDDEVTRSDSQTTVNLTKDDTEDNDESTPSPVTSIRRSGTERIKNDEEPSNEGAETNNVDTSKSINNNDNAEKSGKNVNSDNSYDDSTTNNEDNIMKFNDKTNSRDSTSEITSLLNGHRRMLHDDDDIFDTKARSGHDGLNNHGAMNSLLLNSITPAQTFIEIETPISYPRLKSSVADSQFPVLQSPMDIANQEFSENSKHDRNTYEYSGVPAQMLPVYSHPSENIERSNVATMSPITTPIISLNTNIQRNAATLANDPYLLNLLKLANMNRNSNRFYYPSPPMFTTPVMNPYLIQKFPQLPSGSFRLY